MQFLLLAYDSDDALSRRYAVRDKHIKLGDQMRDSGNLLYAVGILNDKNELSGSLMVFEFDSRDELDEYLKIEPYILGNVWGKFEIKSCKVGPSFSKN